MSWQLHRAGIDDLDSIMRLETGIFGNDAWSGDSMRSELVNSQCYYLVAERLGFPGVVDGYAGLFAPSGAEEGDIRTIAVAEEARRGGLGRTLIQSLVTEARKRGAAQVFLEVRAVCSGYGG
ncbi:MAG: GNAT family N-acetyltransferase, partial [Lacisediminihabitans sp.]